MTSLRFFPLVGVVLLAVGCSKTDSFVEPSPPLAAITWMNAIPDTGQVDMRIVDIVSNAGLYDANFRTAMTFPQGIEAGNRQIRVFMSSSNPAISSQVLIDTIVSFAADQRYGFYVNGFARAGQARALITTYTPPALTPGKFAIRVVNLAPSFAGAVPAIADTTVAPDAFIRRISTAPGGAPEATNVTFRGTSAYVVLDTGRYTLGLTATGTTSPALVRVPLPVGLAGSPGVDPIAGSLIPGSVITAVIVPRSVLTAPAPQGGRPTARNTQLLTLSNDTVTLQTGSVTVLTNRSPTKPDTTLATSGTTTAVNAGDAVNVTGAAQTEYNGWHAVMANADSLACRPTNLSDTPTKCAAVNDTATTFFRYRYRILGAPASPATGTTQYRVYPPTFGAADFTVPNIVFVVDRRP